MAFVWHVKPGTWLIQDNGLCKGPVGLSYNKALKCWTLSKNVFREDVAQHKFYDRDYGHHPYRSYSAALLHIQEGRQLRKLEMVERDCKERKVSVCGVSYYRHPDGIHRFNVSNPLGGGTTVYIGTDYNYTNNIDKAFERAVLIRHQFERDHAVKSYWSAQSCSLSCGV